MPHAGLTYEDFVPHVGSDFSIPREGATDAVIFKLMEVTPLSHKPPSGDFRDPFRLIFRVSEDESFRRATTACPILRWATRISSSSRPPESMTAWIIARRSTDAVGRPVHFQVDILFADDLEPQSVVKRLGGIDPLDEDADSLAARAGTILDRGQD